MKIKSLGNKSTRAKFLSAHNRTVRFGAQGYLIRTATLGPNILADAEPMPQGGATINIFDKNIPLARNLRTQIELGNFS